MHYFALAICLNSFPASIFINCVLDPFDGIMFYSLYYLECGIQLYLSEHNTEFYFNYFGFKVNSVFRML